MRKLNKETSLPWIDFGLVGNAYSAFHVQFSEHKLTKNPPEAYEGRHVQDMV